MERLTRLERKVRNTYYATDEIIRRGYSEAKDILHEEGCNDSYDMVIDGAMQDAYSNIICACLPDELEEQLLTFFGMY